MLEDILSVAERDTARAELAPGGTLRAAINRGNPLLVTGLDVGGRPLGIAPDIAAMIGGALGVPVDYEVFARPGETADAVGRCGIVLIAQEPERARTIAFSPGYVTIDATYLVRSGSAIVNLSDIDRVGVEIIVSERSAYDLWLTRHLLHARLLRRHGIDAAFDSFSRGEGHALAGLRPALSEQARLLAGSIVLEGCFTSVAQAVGTATSNTAGAAFLREVVIQACSSGRVERIVAAHGIKGLRVGTTG